MSSVQNVRLAIRAVLYQEEGRWIAHCLEFDLLGDGASMQEALCSLAQAIEIQVGFAIDENNLAALFTPAEGRYFEMFAQGHNEVERESEGDLPVSCIERLEARVFDAGNLRASA